MDPFRNLGRAGVSSATMCKSCPTVSSEQWTFSTDTVRTHLERPMSNYIVWFDKYDDADKPRVGGKCASLGEMIRAGLPVPPGFAVTTDAYRECLAAGNVADDLTAHLDGIDGSDLATLATVGQVLRNCIANAPMSHTIEHDIRTAYQVLCEQTGVDDLPVAVRSSATAEDLPDASFAGQQDTYLWVCGADNVVAQVRNCWASLFTDRAIAYRHETGHDHEAIHMSVAVQMMVQPTAAGVAFTLNPTDGDRSQIAIDASYGFGEAVVSGEVTPDNFMVDKVLKTIVKRTISPKHMEYRLTDDNTVVQADVDEERQTQACMTDDEVIAVAHMARICERHYGSPQDVEWAIDANLLAPDNIVLLQSRPETVWSQKKRRTVAPGGSFMDSIVATLVSPVHAREKQSTVVEGSVERPDD